MTTTMDELAASLGLKVVKGELWGTRLIRDATGHTLDVVGIAAVPAWLCGYKAALGAAGRRMEQLSEECADHSPVSASAFASASDALRVMGAPTPCSNPECCGGSVGGHAPHACGER